MMDFCSPLVSICIPTYRHGEFINETIESLIDQSYRNIEIIVSDNGSNDGTEDICENWTRNDSRIKYIKHDRNIGYINNIRSAVEATRGSYLAIYHSDDVYEKTIIERELKVLIENTDVDAVFSTSKYLVDGEIVDPPSGKKILRKLRNVSLSIDDSLFVGNRDIVLDNVLQLGNFLVCPSMMCRRDKYLSIGGYRDSYKGNEDLDLWLRFLDTGSSIAVILAPLVFYRKTSSQMSMRQKVHGEIPIQYYLIRDYYDEHKYQFANKSIEKEHRKYRSRVFLMVGIELFNIGKRAEASNALRKSMIEWRYSLATKIGIKQRVLLLISYLLNAIENRYDR